MRPFTLPNNQGRLADALLCGYWNSGNLPEQEIADVLKANILTQFDEGYPPGVVWQPGVIFLMREVGYGNAVEQDFKIEGCKDAKHPELCFKTASRKSKTQFLVYNDIPLTLKVYLLRSEKKNTKTVKLVLVKELSARAQKRRKVSSDAAVPLSPPSVPSPVHSISSPLLATPVAPPSPSPLPLSPLPSLPHNPTSLTLPQPEYVTPLPNNNPAYEDFLNSLSEPTDISLFIPEALSMLKDHTIFPFNYVDALHNQLGLYDPSA